MLKCKRSISLIISVVMIITLAFNSTGALFTSAAEQSNWKTAKELIKERGFLSGVQMVETYSGTTGNDIGDSGIWKTKANFNPEVWKEFFENSKAMGFDICKIWNSYQMGGILFDSDWKVIGPSETYLQNLETIFQLAQEKDLYICLTLMTHFESFFRDNLTKITYDKIARFIHNETYRDCFIKNWVKPVLELSKEYPNVIMVDLYCEPEADGGLWRLTQGTNWDNMRTFISELQKAVEKYNPYLSTYCSSADDSKRLGNLYGELGLDYYGYDLYNSDGTSLDPRDYYLDRPLIYGEIGATDMGNKDSNLSTFYQAYLNSCVGKGIKAAFYWSYHPSNTNSQSLLDDTATHRLREATWAFRTWSSDRQNTINNTTAKDKPAIMYSTSDYLRWFGARNATSYDVQRSEDKTNWSSIATISSNNNKFHNYMYQYVDSSMQSGHTYYYRIKANFSSGNTISDLSYGIIK